MYMFNSFLGSKKRLKISNSPCDLTYNDHMTEEQKRV